MIVVSCLFWLVLSKRVVKRAGSNDHQKTDQLPQPATSDHTPVLRNYKKPPGLYKGLWPGKTITIDFKKFPNAGFSSKKQKIADVEIPVVYLSNFESLFENKKRLHGWDVNMNFRRVDGKLHVIMWDPKTPKAIIVDVHKGTISRGKPPNEFYQRNFFEPKH